MRGMRGMRWAEMAEEAEEAEKKIFSATPRDINCVFATLREDNRLFFNLR